jgi:hypothetical protein
LGIGKRVLGVKGEVFSRGDVITNRGADGFVGETGRGITLKGSGDLDKVEGIAFAVERNVRRRGILGNETALDTVILERHVSGGILFCERGFGEKGFGSGGRRRRSFFFSLTMTGRANGALRLGVGKGLKRAGFAGIDNGGKIKLTLIAGGNRVSLFILSVDSCLVTELDTTPERFNHISLGFGGKAFKKKAEYHKGEKHDGSFLTNGLA